VDADRVVAGPAVHADVAQDVEVVQVDQVAGAGLVAGPEGDAAADLDLDGLGVVADLDPVNTLAAGVLQAAADRRPQAGVQRQRVLVVVQEEIVAPFAQAQGQVAGKEAVGDDDGFVVDAADDAGVAAGEKALQLELVAAGAQVEPGGPARLDAAQADGVV